MMERLANCRRPLADVVRARWTKGFWGEVVDGWTIKPLPRFESFCLDGREKVGSSLRASWKGREFGLEEVEEEEEDP